MSHVSFKVFENETGFCALDSNNMAGYGSTAQEAIADLQLAYDESNMEIYEFEFFDIQIDLEE